MASCWWHGVHLAHLRALNTSWTWATRCAISTSTLIPHIVSCCSIIKNKILLSSYQATLKHLKGLVSYTEPIVDPSRTYRVKVRTRMMTNICIGPAQWSQWSPTVCEYTFILLVLICMWCTDWPWWIQYTVVERSFYEFNTLLIISISLGIPMILLAVLLLVRQQR